MKSLAPNTLLQNRYLIVHLIGKGGMGDVYLAVDQRLGSAVALKRTFFADDETLGNAFEREAKTLARLRHPVLPKVSDHFVENDEQFLVMEHISGDDLSKRLETSQKPFPVSWVLFWADQLLDALAYLHAHEPPIIHRDIKPQNLKLTDENSIILLDFGLSKNNAGETKRVASGGSTGSVVGYTPHYAPMEQIRGTGTSPRSDIYALSATIYQLMTNAIPSDALTRADALLNGMEDPIRPLYEINPEIPPAVSAVILKGMEISQDRRFPGAREMQKTLREAFSQIQNQMAAQTIAFNLQNEFAAENIQPPHSGVEKPENSSFPANNQTSFAAPQPDVAPASKSNPVLSYNSGAAANLDATLRMDSQASYSPEKPAQLDSPPLQAGVKTEVFLGGASALVPPAPPEFDFGSEKTSGSEVSTDSQGFAPDGNHSADIHAGSSAKQNFQPADSEFFSSPAIAAGDDFSIAAPTRSFTATDFAAETEQLNSFSGARGAPLAPEQAKTVPVVKKSANKAVAVFGGLFAFFVLAAIAVGGGWYFYQNRQASAGAEEKATPSSAAVSEYSPTPAPTIEAAVESNVNPAVSNVNAETVSSDSDSATDADNRNSQTNSQISNQQNNQPSNQTTAGTSAKPRLASTPRSAAPPDRAAQPKPTAAPKPNAKPTAKKPSAPVILQ